MCLDVPKVEDAVIGIIEEKLSGFYRVGINGTLPGTLPFLAFEGATKRTKPTLKIGDLVYVRIISAPKDIEPELSCIAIYGTNRKGWETGEATFGILNGGNIIKCTLSQSETLRQQSINQNQNHHDDHSVFKELEKQQEGIKYECVIGCNGMIWINASTPQLIICLTNVIKNSFVVKNDEIKSMIKKIFELNRDRIVDNEEEEE
mmetsp:Transcript_48602/g.62396  ORF Transcript_48602/g.62396 Transcript_48602/m.62396 type:complete len:204 (+) Transcript_48602:31-642(+)